ncbi:regulatory protein RecX [Salinibius halmophilus]|uniref:regulatory protein RecX n=1 Tax=Salinibius halmophilus TaxID=1853216 RepID=UPI000E66C067|nr:regulatory protein RecX [Salinibius halmophilus]
MQTEKSAFEVGVDLLSRREHSQTELRQKIGQKGYESDDIEAAIERLVELGYQSDERFCEQFIRAKVSRGDGPMKIRSALSQRGIKAQLAQPIFAEQDWYEIALEVSRKRAEQARDFKQQQKFTRWLVGRGFDFDTVRKVISYWQRNEEF